MQNTDWKRFFLVAALILITANLAGTFLGRAVNQREAQGAAEAPIRPELRVMTSSQSSDGARQEDFTPQLAEVMEKYTVGRLTAKLEAKAKEAGMKLPPPIIRSESTVFETQGKRLVIVRLEINSTARAVEVLGIDGPTLNRVMCVRESLDEILIASGPCGEKIREVHGVKIGS